MLQIILIYCACSKDDNEIPLVLIHGFISDYSVFDILVENIRRDFPNRQIIVPKIQFDFFSSVFCGLTRYVRIVATSISKSVDSECIDLIGHSQGGLVTRSYIQLFSGQKNYPSVRNYISLAGAQGGFFCGDNCTDFGKMVNTVMKLVKKIIYSNFVQVRMTPAGYWRDPFNYEQYQKQCGILAQINGECSNQSLATGKSNILALNKFVNIYSAIDEVLMPKTTGNFAMYEPKTGQLLELEENPIYFQDKIGLKRLKEENKMISCRTDIYHMDFVKDEFYETHLKKILSGEEHLMVCE
ncbi:Palmitoyl-protein_thioesterase [Hexamita inflata]|uniref:Palmitoyl-protein thioesterase n=1 Tax=Hexamita inflata TaxID=28002 RepID=A0AA86Q3A2_9EUKA|nr:Palmitoyl-protein thioesterase [Hexamita inflata]